MAGGGQAGREIGKQVGRQAGWKAVGGQPVIQVGRQAAGNLMRGSESATCWCGSSESLLLV